MALRLFIETVGCIVLWQFSGRISSARVYARHELPTLPCILLRQHQPHELWLNMLHLAEFFQSGEVILVGTVCRHDTSRLSRIRCRHSLISVSTVIIRTVEAFKSLSMNLWYLIPDMCHICFEGGRLWQRTRHEQAHGFISSVNDMTTKDVFIFSNSLS